MLIDPARVTFTPTVQYLPLRLSGVVRCHVEAHPPFQFITWTKDKRIFDPFETPNVGVLKNGSLLFEKVINFYLTGFTVSPLLIFRVLAYFSGDARQPGSLYLHSLQRTRDGRILCRHGSVGERAAYVCDHAKTNLFAQNRR